MLSFARRRLTFANVAMTAALVFAMTGGAFAAGKFLITSTKQISPKVLKSLQGKAGPAGAAGAQGSAGPAGASGPQGPAGAAGAKGETGVEGKEGKEGKAGKDGKAGLTGSPWPAGGTLPTDSTETGVWAFGPFENSGGPSKIESVASFTIPLAVPLDEKHVHFINTDGMEITTVNEVEGKLVPVEIVPIECGSGIGPGVDASNPQAKPGNLCVYAEFLRNVVVSDEGFINGAGRSGAFLSFFFEAVPQLGLGSWAVTAS